MSERRGVLAWFVNNPVAANLLMLGLLFGGIVVGFSIKQEVFPDFKIDAVSVTVPYPGASPEEVEQGILLAVEEAIRGIDGVDRVTSAATEGVGNVYASLEIDADPNATTAELKNAVDRITSFPADAERPTVSLITNRFEVISLVLHGDMSRQSLRDIAEDVRDDLLELPGITNVELVGAPAHEISIEIPQTQLRGLGLALDDVAQRIRATAIELPGGSVRTRAGEVLLRTTERRHTAEEFADIPMGTGASGTALRLGDIAVVRESFEETDESAFFNGEPALMVKVFRTGNQTPIEVADTVKEYVETLRPELPRGVSASVWLDWSEIYRQRIDLLVRNAQIGLVLVLLILGMFLELRLAFWVTMGIPVSFLGALFLMPALDVTVNMISLFAFIVTLGMVVDDAIVVGENVFELRQRGVPRLEAAIRGVREVAVPVTFSIATTIAAFAPMLFVPGLSGKLYRVIPSIVIAVLTISLIESLWVLPAHLASLKDPPTKGWYAWFLRHQQRIKSGLERFIDRSYNPFLRKVVRRRYVTLSVGLAILMASGGLIAGGHIPFRFMPEVEGDVLIASVEFPYGTPVSHTERVGRQVLEAAEEVVAQTGEKGIVRGIFSQVGTPLPRDPGTVSTVVKGGHVANVQLFLVEADHREATAGELMHRWRERVGRVAGAERVKFSFALGPTPGPPIHVELVADDMDVLDKASADLADTLRDYAGVWDVDDGFAVGKPQFDLKLTEQATSLGLVSLDVARQVRNAFYGAEALRQQNEREEVKVIVRLPQDERRTIHDFETLTIRTPAGKEIPLYEAAEITRGRAWPIIQRADGHRMIAVTAEVQIEQTSPGTVIQSLSAQGGVLDQLAAKYPGLRYEFGGSQREQAKAMGSLTTGGYLAAAAVFALLAIPFRSNIQPIIVMAAIPFGVVGAILGHLIMGYEFSMISVMGIIALGGVVVNDSLVLIAAANDYRREGLSPNDAIHAAGVRRFRPILLTSLTTFFGLMPMILETSVQARFLIPMAISLGFGVAFATFIVLLLVPAFYMMVEDIRPSPRPDE